jgi:SAM-dependent methyltransferase
MSTMPNFFLKRHYEMFNEGQFLLDYSPEIKGKKLFDVGCATGDLYRYISNYMKEYDYHGFDVSEPGIRRAGEKYGSQHFTKIDPQKGIELEKTGRPDVVFCRDVIVHQEKPYEFLDYLIDMAAEAVFLRVRTRDVGKTVLDPKISCQLHWDKHWEPYMVLNTVEMIERIKSHKRVKKIVIGRRYEVLGGFNLRYLPKELYFTSARAAETAIFLHLSQEENEQEPTLEFRDKQDGKHTFFYRLFDAIYRRLKR